MAEFVNEQYEYNELIPGRLLHSESPLSEEEWKEVFELQETIPADIIDFSDDIAAKIQTELPIPSEIETRVNSIQNIDKQIEKILKNMEWTIENINSDPLNIIIHIEREKVSFRNKSLLMNESDIPMHDSSIDMTAEWIPYIINAGKNKNMRLNWEMLIHEIEETKIISDKLINEKFGKTISVVSYESLIGLEESLIKMGEIFKSKRKLSRLDYIFNKSFKEILSLVKIDEMEINSFEDCQLLINEIRLNKKRKTCGKYWDELLAKHGMPEFFELDSEYPENIAYKWIIPFKWLLDWHENEFLSLSSKLCEHDQLIFNLCNDGVFRSEIQTVQRELEIVYKIIPTLSQLFGLLLELEKELIKKKEIINHFKLMDENIFAGIANAIDKNDYENYKYEYEKIYKLIEKRDRYTRFQELLSKIKETAPELAEAMQNKEYIHKDPQNMMKAWEWKNCLNMLNELTNVPYEKLQQDSIKLSNEYRKITAQLAEKKAWFYLIQRIETNLDMKQALQGWKQTVKKIGKGTGKMAPVMKKRARELMVKCQNAVPAWIMPVNKALESLNPSKNRFDILIIDEASQSDISALSIIYMGKKIIVVGDDRQVSPMAVGIDIDKMDALSKMYLKDLIPNSHLYTSKTSIYDIAATTYQPLMLREHFRCVPDIINYSNNLSYDGKIRPLRASNSTNLSPAVINYRVEDGEWDPYKKINIREAQTIVSLIKSCLSISEYDNKTFGVISMVGEEQARYIQELLLEAIPSKDYEDRKLLCGNSASFQGDERDVIFLSMVHSNNGEGPLPLYGFGPDDAYKKRYNVAVSRARDQLWVIHSLDSSNDLKPGDLRKNLIEYAKDPHAITLKLQKAEEDSESPFEEEVSQTLIREGYHIVQQWIVGSFRIDMVVIYGDKKVALECDGERWHSGEEKIYEDMERQTILERIGWEFIRIRGSEYYSNKEETIQRVKEKLSEYGIYPEGSINKSFEERSSLLLDKVIAGASKYLEDFEEKTNFSTIEFALSSKQSIRSDENVENNNDINKNAKLIINAEENVEGNHTSKVKDKKESFAENQGVQLTFEDMGIALKKETEDDIIMFIKSANISFVDKRKNNGALWIIGGMELRSFVSDCREKGYNFIFKSGGGRATKGRDAWWLKK